MPIESFVEALLEGLREHNLAFATSRGSFGGQLCEIFIEEVSELILIPNGVLDQDLVHWILEMRTPIEIRLTIFTNEMAEYKIRVMRAVSDLRQDGVEIPNVDDAISVQEPSARNLARLLESLENWHDLKSRGRPFPRRNCAKSDFGASRASQRARSEEAENASSLGDKLDVDPDCFHDTQADLYLRLRNGIKTYWTEKYLTRFLKLSPEKAREIAQRVGIVREACGQEILYFFDRVKALRAYFVHVLKGLLDEMGLRYEEGPNDAFFLPEFNVAVVFFDGNKEQLQVLAEDYARSYDLIFVVPEQLRVVIGRVQDDFFRIVSLAKSNIAHALRGLGQLNHADYKPVVETHQTGTR